MMKRIESRSWEDIILEEAISWFCSREDLQKITKFVIIGLGINVKPILKYLSDIKEIGQQRIDRKFHIGYYKGIPISVIYQRGGAPQTEFIVRVLAESPARTLIGIGACGGLQERVEIGDIIIPTAAVRGEGTTGYYAPKEIPAIPDFHIVEAFANIARKEKARYHLGPVWTTSASIKETEQLIEECNRLGILGIDMETSALFLLSSLHGLKSAAILAVSDHPLRKQTHHEHPEFTKKWKEAWDKAVKIILEAIKAMYHVSG
jgi:uridine phosphorylase